DPEVPSEHVLAQREQPDACGYQRENASQGPQLRAPASQPQRSPRRHEGERSVHLHARAIGQRLFDSEDVEDPTDEDREAAESGGRARKTSELLGPQDTVSLYDL